MEINKSTLAKFRKDFAAAVADLEKEYGVDLHIGNIKYTNSDFTTKLNVVNRTATGESVDIATEKMKNDFSIYAYRYNLEGYLGETFEYRGMKYTIIGLKPRSKKYPIVVESSKGRFKFAANTVQLALGIEPTPVDGF